MAHKLMCIMGALLALSPISARDQFIFGDSNGLTGIPAKASDSETLETKWNCTVRGWVRAPDLSPSQTFPGEARLAANGSTCENIAGWAVGLRMKERTIVKLKSRSATSFPVEPTRKPFNVTARVPSSTDYNDIFRGSNGIYYDNVDEEYRNARLAYDEAIRNRKLWDVEGVERNVFDIGRSLSFDRSKEEFDFDIVEPFHVNVPNTNFPPIEDRSSSSQVQGADNQLLNSETLFEYYLNVTLSNGTVLDIPAGRAGFIPDLMDLPDREWPREVVLNNPRINGSDEVDEKAPTTWMQRETTVPACDKHNRVDFDITVTPTPSTAIAGQNITLDIVLNRRGNGTEHPSVLNVHLHSGKELDWAKTQVGSEKAYQDLIDDKSHLGGVHSRINGYRSSRRLAIKPMDVLEKERERRERAGRSSSHSYGQHRPPLRVGGGRYDFEELEEAELDQYQFQIEVQVPYDMLPTFNSTFHSFHPQINFQLHTVFLCVLEEKEQEEKRALDVSAIQDKAWVEAELPSRIKSKRQSNTSQRGLLHTSNVEFNLVIPSIPDHESREDVVSYSDSLALAPVISLDDAETIEYPLVGHTIRMESRLEHLRSRYSHERDEWIKCPGRKCNLGGANKHAAKMWQEKEIAAKQLKSEREAELASTEMYVGGGSAWKE